MGLDINLFRAEKGGNPETIKESCRKRFADVQVVDNIVSKDEEWRKSRFVLDNLNKEYNKANKDVAAKKKESKGKDPCTEEIQAVKEIDNKIKLAKEDENIILQDLQKLVNKIGNIVHTSVPVSNNEDDNTVLKKWGEIKDIKKISQKGVMHHHHEILAMIDGYDAKRGSKIAGHRGYFLKGYGQLLNLALVNFGTQFLMKKGYTNIQTPFFMKKEVMEETCQLSDFEENLYKIQMNEKNPNEDMYLIATSEQPISSMYRKEFIQEKDLPIRYAGISTCFRKEAGSAGKDNWGIFRVHQFEKVEQFVFTTEEKSWEELDKMIGVSEEFYQALNLPYRVVSIVSGALNDAAAKKMDLEAWFPGYNDYRELVSCSNCTDYQSRNLDVRVRTSQKNEIDKKFVHMLNGTLTATERTLCCILENYQTDEGVVVPDVLKPFVGVDFIPYTQAKPSTKDLE